MSELRAHCAEALAREVAGLRAESQQRLASAEASFLQTITTAVGPVLDTAIAKGSEAMQPEALMAMLQPALLEGLQPALDRLTDEFTRLFGRVDKIERLARSQGFRV